MLSDILAASGTPPPADDFWYNEIGQATHAGIHVTPETAMRFATVFACIQKISKTISSLPVRVYEDRGSEGKYPTDHELNAVLDWKGNNRSTGITVRSSMVANRLGWGNGVAEITWTNGGKVGGLTPLMSKYLRPKISDRNELLWEHWPEGRYDTTLPPGKYLHDPGPFVVDGLLGVTPIAAKEAIGGAIGAETFHNSYFGNGASPGGFLEFPADLDLSDERQDDLVEGFNKMWRGADKAHKVGRLREGVTFNQIGMKLEEMQLIDLRKFDRIQICSIFDVPPPMIQELDPGKYTAIEQAMIAWVRDSLLPVCKATEAVYKRTFFPDSNLYVKHNLAGLARGDMKARGEFYAKGIMNGWFNVDDVREMEELNPVDGGKQNWIPQNLMPLTMGGQVVGPQQQIPADNGEGSDDARQVIIVNTLPSSPVDAEAIGRQVAEAIAVQSRPIANTDGIFEPLFAAEAKRAVTREEKNVASALKRHAGDSDAYAQWAVKFYRGHQEYLRESLEPIVCGLERMTEQTASERPAEFAARYTAEQSIHVLQIMTEGATFDAGLLFAELQKTYLSKEQIPCLTN